MPRKVRVLTYEIDLWADKIHLELWTKGVEINLRLPKAEAYELARAILDAGKKGNARG